jgi:hypothetical protein
MSAVDMRCAIRVFWFSSLITTSPMEAGEWWDVCIMSMATAK